MFGFAAHLLWEGKVYIVIIGSSVNTPRQAHIPGHIRAQRKSSRTKSHFSPNFWLFGCWIQLDDGRVTCACAPCASGRGRRGLRRDGRSCAPSPPPWPAQAARAAAGWSSCCCWTGTTRTVPGAWLPYIVLDSHWVGSGVHPGQLSQSQPSPHVNPLRNHKTSSPLANTLLRGT